MSLLRWPRPTTRGGGPHGDVRQTWQGVRWRRWREMTPEPSILRPFSESAIGSLIGFAAMLVNDRVHWVWLSDLSFLWLLTSVAVIAAVMVRGSRGHTPGRPTRTLARLVSLGTLLAVDRVRGGDRATFSAPEVNPAIVAVVMGIAIGLPLAVPQLRTPAFQIPDLLLLIYGQSLLALGGPLHMARAMVRGDRVCLGEWRDELVHDAEGGRRAKRVG